MQLLPRTREQMRPIPQTDEWGFFGIRFESIGGYGANSAASILTEAGVLHQGFNGSHFSSYGSEKKGTPVTAYIRFCAADHEVRTSAPIEAPHLIAVFHEALVRTHPVLAGLRPEGIVLLNTSKTPAAARSLLNLQYGTLGVLDATRIALDEGSRANMVLLGATCRVVPFLDPEAVKAVIAETYGKNHAKAVPGNLRAFERGYQELLLDDVPVAADMEPKPVRRPQPSFGYVNEPIGGIITNPGNSVLKDLSASRQGLIPEFVRAACIDCAQCDLVCPDMCFVWAPGSDARGNPALELRGIDYQYCKGCMRCVDACPTDALVERREEDGWADAHRVPHSFVLMPAAGR